MLWNLILAHERIHNMVEATQPDENKVHERKEPEGLVELAKEGCDLRN